MNKTEAQKQLKKLEDKFNEEVAALRKIIDTPPKPPSLLSKPEPFSEEKYWCITIDSSQERRQFRAVEYLAFSCKKYDGGNIFDNEADAEDMAYALNTLLLLRHRPGSVPPVDKKEQYIIEPSGNTARPCKWNSIELKLSRISPCFSSYDFAMQAINCVGPDRICRMWNTLHGIK